MKTLVRMVQRAYPRIYLACHRRHQRRGTTSDSLSPRDEGILSHLELERGRSPTRLAAHLSIGRPTLTEAIDRLEEVGLVERRRNERDRRQVELFLTEAGDRLSSRQSVLDEARVRQALALLDSKERVRAVEGLELLAEACSRLRGGT